MESWEYNIRFPRLIRVAKPTFICHLGLGVIERKKCLNGKKHLDIIFSTERSPKEEFIKNYGDDPYESKKWCNFLKNGAHISKSRDRFDLPWISGAYTMTRGRISYPSKGLFGIDSYAGCSHSSEAETCRRRKGRSKRP